MSQMFPLIDVLGGVWHGVLWGFKARSATRYQPERDPMSGPRLQGRAKAQAGQQP